MLIGYVSDERYVALPDVLFEFQDAAGNSWETRSRASGGVICDLPLEREYQVTLWKPGFGAKRVLMIPDPRQPYQFRLLADGLLGYVWPKSVRASERGEFRLHSVEPYKLELCRYGWEKGSSSPAWVGTTNTVHVPRCKLLPTAITRAPASPGTRSATAVRATCSLSMRRRDRDCTIFTPRRRAVRHFRFPGSSHRNGRQRR